MPGLSGTYREKDKEGNISYLDETDGIKRIGPIADDILTVKPDVVVTDKNGDADAIYDKQVFWAMLDQIQKLKTRIEALENVS